MPHRTPHIEQNSRGNLRYVIPGRSSGRKSDRQLLAESEEREAALDVQIATLQTRLSYTERDLWQLQNSQADHQRLINTHNGCRHMQAQLEGQIRHTRDQLEGQMSEVRRFKDLLFKEEDETKRLLRQIKKLDETIRLLKRTSGDYEVYRQKYDDKKAELDICLKKYDDKTLDVERLRRKLVEKDRQLFDCNDAIRAMEIQLASRDRELILKDRHLRHLKNFLQYRGFNVQLPH